MKHRLRGKYKLKRVFHLPTELEHVKVAQLCKTSLPECYLLLEYLAPYICTLKILFYTILNDPLPISLGSELEHHRALVQLFKILVVYPRLPQLALCVLCEICEDFVKADYGVCHSRVPLARRSRVLSRHSTAALPPLSVEAIRLRPARNSFTKRNLQLKRISWAAGHHPIILFFSLFGHL